jgi:hypothetical protein
MASIFTLESNNNDFSEKINIDDLYEKKKKHDLQKLETFNKLLNRVHIRIKATSAQKTNEQYCWFIVPEIILGVPNYDQPACIAYLIQKLQANNFRVKYVHPNALFITWIHWIPSYIRAEYKKKTGITIDETGNVISESSDNAFSVSTDSGKSKQIPNQENNYNHLITNSKSNTTANKKEYNNISSYKPSGNLIYDKNMTQKFH